MRKTRSPFLTEHQRSLLLSWLESPALTTAMAQRVRIVLASADGHSVRATARRLGLSPDTVFLWRRRFQREGLDGLRSRQRPGRPRRIGHRRKEAIVAAVRSRGGARIKPASAALVARAAGVSRTTVRRLWRERLAVAPDPGDRDHEATAAGTERQIPGRILGIFLGRSVRVVARLRKPGQPDRRVATAADGTGAILTAFEAFSPRVQPRPREDDDAGNRQALASFLERLVDLPASRLEFVGHPWRGTSDQLWRALPEEPRLAWRLLRARTRGEWLTTVGRWIADAPAAQERALAGALGHLTDHFASWGAGSGPFVWVDGSPERIGTPAARTGQAPVRGRPVAPVDRS